MSVTQPAPSRSSVQGTDSVDPAGPAASVPNSPGSPAPQTMTQSSDNISTRTCRRSATAAGKAPHTVNYGFGLGGGPRTSSMQVTIPPRVPRPRPAPPAATTPALADSPARTVPLLPDHNRAKRLGIPLLRLTRSPGGRPTAPTRSDALGDDDTMRFADSVARYSHDD